MVHGSTRNTKAPEIRHAIRQRYDLIRLHSEHHDLVEIFKSMHGCTAMPRRVFSSLMFQYKIDYAIEIAGGIRITPKV
jgi:hypothetical protein